MSDPCVQEVKLSSLQESLNRICTAQETQALNTVQINKNIHDILLENREIVVRLKNVEKDVDICFDDVRVVKAEISTLRSELDLAKEKFKAIDLIGDINTRLTVSENVLKAVKIIATAATVALTGIAIAAVYGGQI